MDIGVFTRVYASRDLDVTFKKMRKDGISHCQLNLINAGIETLPNSISDEKLREISSASEKYGIMLEAITGTFNMIDPDSDVRKMGCRQFAIQCRIASELKIPIITLCTGSRSPRGKWIWDDANLETSAWHDLMRSTEDILKYAEQNRIVLGVEPETSNVINTPLRARRYLDEFASQNLKIIMDGANLFRPEQVSRMYKVLDEAFELLGNDIVIAHAKDFRYTNQISYAAVGEGNMDFGYYVHLLKQYKYDGALIMHGLSESQVLNRKLFLETFIDERRQSRRP